MDVIKKAVEVLNRDGIVIYPTETVYGLGCNAYSLNAVKRVFEIKKRKANEPLSLAVSSFEMLQEIAYVDEAAWDFIVKFLPGPITVLLLKKPIVPDFVTSGSKIVGIRFPDHKIALELISQFGKPITSTSANISGEPAPKSADEVKVKADFLIDGGKCYYGKASTIVDLVNKKIVREGPRLEEVQKFLMSTSPTA
ncbi:MAG: L-threonylcarbamoyladenylate synthase [Methanocellales archaeon]